MKKWWAEGCCSMNSPVRKTEKKWRKNGEKTEKKRRKNGEKMGETYLEEGGVGLAALRLELHAQQRLERLPQI